MLTHASGNRIAFLSFILFSLFNVQTATAKDASFEGFYLGLNAGAAMGFSLSTQ
jgi:hypothetical protein